MATPKQLFGSNTYYQCRSTYTIAPLSICLEADVCGDDKVEFWGTAWALLQNLPLRPRLCLNSLFFKLARLGFNKGKQAFGIVAMDADTPSGGLVTADCDAQV